MQNPMRTNKLAPAKTTNEVLELTDADLKAVSGGLNPQPLPPCQHERF